MKSVQPVVHKTRKLESINQKIQGQTRQNLDFINKGRFEVKNSEFKPSMRGISNPLDIGFE